MLRTSCAVLLGVAVVFSGKDHGVADADHKLCDEIKSRDCQAILDQNNASESGKYRIYPVDNKHFDVYCDMESHYGGWIVLLRRQDGSKNFNRTWGKYKKGFGKLNGEFWMGFQNINAIYDLISDGIWELVIDMRDKVNATRYAIYQNFSLGTEDISYMLTVGNFMGNVADKMLVNDGMKFSTVDVDNDQNDDVNCAAKYGPWWHNNCSDTNLTGEFDYMQWGASIVSVEMKMKHFEGSGGWHGGYGGGGR